MASILENWSTQTLFIGCALVGGVVLTLQLGLLIFGIDGEAEVDGGGDGFGLISLRTLASLIATFGLVGWWALDAGYGSGAATGFGVLAGMVMMGLVAWLFSLQSKLHQDGSVDTSAAVGKTAIVYLRVPEVGTGQGKITVQVQGRSHEFTAVSKAAMIPTGAEVRITRQITENTFEIEAL